MSKNKTPKKLIVDELVATLEASVERERCLRHSASVVLESLVAHHSTNEILSAVAAQGFSSFAYQHDIDLIHDLATRRRSERYGTIASAPLRHKLIVNTLRQLEVATAGEVADAIDTDDIEPNYIYQFLSHRSCDPSSGIIADKIVRNGTSMNQYSLKV